MPTATNRARTFAALGLGMAFLLISFLPRVGSIQLSKPVVEANEADADKWYNQGITALAEKRYDQAIADLSRAIEVYGNLASASLDEMMDEDSRSVKRRRGRISMPEVNRTLHEAGHYSEKYARAITNRADAYSKNAQFQEAIADYSEAIRFSRDTEMYKRRAATYQAIGETAKAEWDERQAEFLGRPKEAEKR